MLGFWFDYEDAMRRHFMRKVLLARYARQSVLQWDDTSITDMEMYVELTMELIKKENQLASEDNSG